LTVTYHDEELAAQGKDIQVQLWGEIMRSGAGGGSPGAKIAPDFFQLVQQFCFGMFWAREELPVKQRSLVTVSQLAALGKLEELKGHLRGALNVGWTREELIEVLMHTAVYAGVPAAVGALNAAAEVLAPPE
jgi:4-carboxymuconolactone decarboxylase